MDDLSAQLTATPGLRELRRATGLSQQELAFRAHCSLPYVAMLERGFAPTHSNVLPRILTALENAATDATTT